jgi:hypothetical protein
MIQLHLCHWIVLIRLMQCAEYCFESIVDYQVRSHMFHTKTVVPFKTMNSPSCKSVTPLKYYHGLALGFNVFLQCRTDLDYTMSIAQVNLQGKDNYELHDEVVAYFCFPTLCVAVPLCPGDFLLFNALIPHCILPRCKQTDNIYCVSMYLKSAIVRTNNNLLPLTTKQAILSKRYQQIISK